MNCKYCGAELQPDERFCYRCGREVKAEPEKRYCISCGAELEQGAVFCSKCGKRAGAAPADGNQTRPVQKPEDDGNSQEQDALKTRTEQLVLAAQGGDSDSFSELYRLYYQKVYALAKTTVKSDADAEDVLQTTFIKAWNNLEKLKNTSAFSTWIQRITLNQCYSLLRKKHVDVSIDNDDEDAESIQLESDLMLPEVYAEQSDLKTRLGKIIRELSAVQQQTITLYYFDGLPVENIAWVMDCSVNTVKSRLFLARKSIKTEIEEQERKSGQPFYGVVGLGLIPFGKLFLGQVQTEALSKAAAASILKGISASIASSAVKGAAGAAGGAAAKAGAGTAAKVGAGTVAKAATAAISKKVIAGIIAGTLAVGAAAGGTIAAVNASKKNKAEAAQTPVVSAELPEQTDPFSIVTPTTSEPEDLLSETERAAYNAYLGCLITNKAGIDNYIWQRGYTEIFDEDTYDMVPLTDQNTARPVALCDVYGDDLPELIYVGDVEPGEWTDEFYYNDSEAYLHIVTYRDGRLVTLYSEAWDGFGDSWNGYHLFQINGEKTLYTTESNGDLSFWDYVYSFTEGADGILHKEQVCHRYEEEDNEGVFYYGKKDQQVSESEYNGILQSLSENTTEVLMYSWIGISAFRDSVEQHGCIAMTSDEAIAYLNGLLNASTGTAEQPAATSYTDAYAAYLDYLIAHKEGIDNYLWQIGGWEYYYDIEEGTERFVLSSEPETDEARTETRSVAFYDIYGDQIPELIYIGDVASPVRLSSVSTLNVLTYQDGHLVSLLSDKWDEPVWEEFTEADSLFVRPDGTLFYYHAEGATFDSQDYYDVFVMGEDGKLHREFALEYIYDSFEFDEGDGSPIVQEWYGPNRKRITEEEYEAQLKTLAPQDSILLFDRYSYAGFAMNADEAIAFLRGQLHEKDAKRIDMYQAYLDVLEHSGYQADILAYERTDSHHNYQSIALRDVYGDELPELLILKQGDLNDFTWEPVDLVIVTYENGNARTIFSGRVSDKDEEGYSFYQLPGDQTLYQDHNFGHDGVWMITYTAFEPTAQGVLQAKEKLFLAEENDWNTSKTTYTVNDRNASKADYDAAMASFESNADCVLQGNYRGDWQSVPAMTYREAIVLLKLYLAY